MYWKLPTTERKEKRTGLLLEAASGSVVRLVREFGL